jgi:hypothetical protein
MDRAPPPGNPIGSLLELEVVAIPPSASASANERADLAMELPLTWSAGLEA